MKVLLRLQELLNTYYLNHTAPMKVASLYYWHRLRSWHVVFLEAVEFTELLIVWCSHIYGLFRMMLCARGVNACFP